LTCLVQIQKSSLFDKKKKTKKTAQLQILLRSFLLSFSANILAPLLIDGLTVGLHSHHPSKS
jgi:hypothetical protein